MIISIIALIIWMLLYLVLFFIDARSILAPDHSLYVFLIYSAISSYCVFFKNISSSLNPSIFSSLVASV